MNDPSISKSYKSVSVKSVKSLDAQSTAMESNPDHWTMRGTAIITMLDD